MKYLKRIRGAVGMGLTWALGWAFAGLLIGVSSVLLPGLPWDTFFTVFDAPLPVLAIPGFVAGVFFSALLSIAARRLTLRELSLQRIAIWGAVAGVLVTAFPFALEAIGLASREGSNIGALRSIAVIVGPFVVLSALSAALTLKLARISDRRVLRKASQYRAGVGGENETRAALAARPAGSYGRSHLETADAKSSSLQRSAD